MVRRIPDVTHLQDISFLTNHGNSPSIYRNQVSTCLDDHVLVRRNQCLPLRKVDLPGSFKSKSSASIVLEESAICGQCTNPKGTTTHQICRLGETNRHQTSTIDGTIRTLHNKSTGWHVSLNLIAGVL